MSNRPRPLVLVLASTLALAGCMHGAPKTTGGTADGGGQIVGPTWMWVYTLTPVEIVTPAVPADYTLQLGTDGRAAVRADCNRGSGNYQLEGPALSFGTLATTLMMCTPASEGERFLRQLGGAAHTFWRGDTLMIDLKVDSGTMRFVRVR